ncbi:hypothetical protein BLGI_4322 [Brevibacillus laterosporus GI-9]|nr:hypothetical protein BLGI_4322 [Brevibacillus laterosporus GI-9]
MHSRLNMNTWSQHTMLAYTYFTNIKHDAIVVGKEMLSKMNIVSITTSKARLYNT